MHDLAFVPVELSANRLKHDFFERLPKQRRQVLKPGLPVKLSNYWRISQASAICPPKSGQIAYQYPNTKLLTAQWVHRLFRSAKPPAPDSSSADAWTQVQTILHRRDPEHWSSWFPHLTEDDRAGAQ
jgi:hypothetical protein